jgi:hypothetical protein
MVRRPTRIVELIPAWLPATLGAQDASGVGMGGVNFVPLPNGQVQPLLWWSKFDDRVTSQLVTFANPGGTITNSDLELAASVAHHDVLAQQVDVREATIHNLTDKTATMYWQRKGATSTTGPASRLLRIQSLHQRHHRYVPSFDYIPGEANAMSDDCSRRWDLTDTQLLAHFDLVFPQSQPWPVCQLPKRMRCALTSALLTSESSPVLPLNEPRPWATIGPVGTHSVWRTILTPTSGHGPIRCPSSKSLVNDTAMDGCPPQEPRQSSHSGGRPMRCGPGACQTGPP